MGSMFRRIAAGLAALATMLALGGCALPLLGQVSAFHEWPADAPRSWRFVRPEAQRDSLERAAWENLLRAELGRAGFVESQAPRFAVGFDYRVQRQAGPVADPFPAFYPWFWFGTWGRHGGIGVGGPWPGWGPGFHPLDSRVWYEHRLRIEIDDLAARPTRRVYEATAVSERLEQAPAEVLPLLARAILADFPGPSGAVRRVEVPLDRER